MIPRLRRLLLLTALLVAVALLKGYVPVNGAERTITGIASWGDWPGKVVTRLPRGTSILVVGPLGGWTGTSWGYGPAEWTGRIVDLDVRVFELLCGPRSIGLCEVTLSW